MELLNDLRNDLRRKRGSYIYDINMAHCNSARDHRYVPTHTKEAWEQENNRLRTYSLT